MHVHRHFRPRYESGVDNVEKVLGTWVVDNSYAVALLLVPFWPLVFRVVASSIFVLQFLDALSVIVNYISRYVNWGNTGCIWAVTVVNMISHQTVFCGWWPIICFIVALLSCKKVGIWVLVLSQVYLRLIFDMFVVNSFLNHKESDGIVFLFFRCQLNVGWCITCGVDDQILNVIVICFARTTRSVSDTCVSLIVERLSVLVLVLL